MNLDAEIKAARERIHTGIDILHAKARAETESMAESARRSIEQRFRYWNALRLAGHYAYDPDGGEIKVSIIAGMEEE